MLVEPIKAPEKELFKDTPGYPSEKKMSEGAVAIIECEQEIPCNPCELACPQSAITVGNPITNLPKLDEAKCIGCGLCIAGCPGQAIFLIDKTYSDDKAMVALPYEYTPLPEIGQEVSVKNRGGVVLGKGNIIKIINNEKNDCTSVVYIEVKKELGEEVRSFE